MAAVSNQKFLISISEYALFDLTLIKVAKFRDAAKEAIDIFEVIGLRKKQSLLEIGTGTGNFAIEAARHCNNVYTIDVSSAMIDYAKQKVHKTGISNISFFQAGFLSYQHDGYPLDVIVSNSVMHHLPDFPTFDIPPQPIISLRLKNNNTKAIMTLEIREEHFPYWSKGWLGTIKRVDIFARDDQNSKGFGYLASA